MGVRVMGGPNDPRFRFLGGDPPEGFDWGDDVDLPGQFRGGGQGFQKPVGALAGPQGVPAPVAQPPGASINSNPFTQPHMQPNGQPEMLPAPSGGFDPLGWAVRMNPFGRAAIAGAEMIRATPADTGEFNPAMVAGRPDAPWDTTHGLPAAALSPHGGIGSDANAPVMGAGGFPTTYAAPGQQPAPLDPVQVVRRGGGGRGGGKKRIDPKTVNVGRGAPINPGWVTQDMQNSDPTARNRPQMGMFDLSTLFKKKA